MSPQRSGFLAFAVVMAVLALATPGGAEPAPTGEVRFGRGVADVMASPMELPDTVAAETGRLGAVGVPVGIVKGVGRAIGRQATGVAAVVGAMGEAEPAWGPGGGDTIAAAADGRSWRVGRGLRE